jgi:hypothetical protein
MKILIIITALFSSVSTYGQSPDFTGVIPDSLRGMPYNLDFEKNCRGSKRIHRSDKTQVIFSFFQDISDTVSVYVNDKLVFNRFVFHDSDLVSTDYTGVSFTGFYKNKGNKIRITYAVHKNYIEFPLNRKYPLYAIYFLQKNRFYVSGRKCIMIKK